SKASRKSRACFSTACIRFPLCKMFWRDSCDRCSGKSVRLHSCKTLGEQLSPSLQKVVLWQRSLDEVYFAVSESRRSLHEVVPSTNAMRCEPHASSAARFSSA